MLHALEANVDCEVSTASLAIPFLNVTVPVMPQAISNDVG
jgi:hypothetical protein